MEEIAQIVQSSRPKWDQATTWSWVPGRVGAQREGHRGTGDLCWDNSDQIKESVMEKLRFLQDAGRNPESLKQPQSVFPSFSCFRTSMLIMGVGSRVLAPG